MRSVATSSNISSHPTNGHSKAEETLRLAPLESSVLERESEFEFELQQADEVAELGSWHWVCSSGLVTCSPDVYRIYGNEPHESQSFFTDGEKLHSPESWDRFSAAVAHTFATGEPYELDMERVYPDRESSWIAVRGEVTARAADGSVAELRGTVRDVTARKHGELDMARAEARYRSLLRVSSDLIWTTGDDSGLQTEELPEWQAFTGQTAEELLGFGWAAAIHPDDREATLLAWDFALKTGTTFRTQHRLRRHDGVYRTMKVRAVPSRDAQGNIIEWVGMHTDITDRLEAEATSRRLNEKLRGVLSAMTDGMLIVDDDWRFSYINEQGANLMGVRPEDLLGKSVWELYPYADQSSFGKMVRQAAETGKPTYTLDYYPQPLNKWLECNFYPSAEGISCYFRDITERKRDEEAMERSNAELLRTRDTLQEVLTGMTDGVSMLDKDGRYTYINEQGANLLGVNSAEVLGKIIWDVFPEAKASSFGRMFRQAVESGQPTRNMDFAPEPVNKWLECNIHPSSQGISIYYRDVTEKQLAGESQLQAEKLAMASSLASSIATELKNPLESATSLIDHCLTMPLSESAHSNLIQARQHLSRASQSSLQALRFQRHPSLPTTADVSALLDSALRLFAPRFSAAGIEVERDYVSHPRLICHAEELRQVFSNLLSNALEATPSGGTIRLRVRPSKVFNGLIVTVADTGEGIPAGLRPRVFDLFTSTKIGSSAGIGLWVSAATVQKHKGRIALRSHTGSATRPSGTVFSIFLPYTGVEGPAALASEKQAGESTLHH